MISLYLLFKGYYKYCECGCKILIPCISYGKFKKYLNNHRPKGKDSPFWKGGRKKQGNYWMLLIPDYYKSDCNGYVSEHVYFYEQYHKVCVLPWVIVHHIEPVTETYCNNMVWNLVTMVRGEHISYHKKGIELRKIDKTDWQCENPECKDPEYRYFDKNGYEQWYKNEIFERLCRKCYNKWYDKNKRKRTKYPTHIMIYQKN